ncbi:CzcE family metal-binding protein [Chitinimonas naiadis]
MSPRWLIGLVVTGLATAAVAAPHPATYADPAHSPDLTVEINPQTRWINVTNDQTITIRQGGSVFSWHVDVLHGEGVVALGAIAPAGFDAGEVRIYVAPNPARQG